ncbi:MAG: HAD family hydrolase [Treponema sp.]|jgi:putative hydrolase of the HAD superfamily|nr:HAD family hydrolase [Treponema sp.]
MRPGIEAVAFDLDGTLYPESSLNVRLVPFILKEWRLLWNFGKARDLIRAEQERSSPLPPSSDFYDHQARLVAQISDADPQLVKERIERFIYRGYEPHFRKIKLFPHVVHTLAALRGAGLKLGMLSDFPPENKLEHLGIAGLWDVVMCSERTGALKPDIRPFATLSAALGVLPERILYVGNNLRYDAAGAKRAGMKTALIAGPLAALSGSRGLVDFTFHDYRQLCKFVLD